MVSKGRFRKDSFIAVYIITLVFFLPVLSFAQKFGDYMQYGRAELEKENYTEAIRYLNNAVNQRPASYEGYFLRGIAKYNLGDYRGAEADFTQSSQFDPYNSEIYNYRAIAKSQQYNFGGAMKDFAKAIELDPKNPVFPLNRARTRLFLQQYQAAIDDCNKAFALKYKDASVFALRGIAEAGLEKYDEAIADLNKAVTLDPKNTLGYVQRGTVLMDMQKPDSAILDFNKAISIDKNDSYAIFNRALARMDTHDTTGALNDLDKVISLSPYNSYAYYNRAILKIGQNKNKEAISDLDKVIALNPDNIVIYLYRGRLRAQTGDLKGALNDFNKSLEIYPDFADAYYERSQVKKQMMDFRGAEADQKKAYVINDFIFSENDSTKLAEQMYLKRLIAFSGEFTKHSADTTNGEEQITSIGLKPIFVTVLYAKNINTVRLFDTFNKPMYHTDVITLTGANNETGSVKTSTDADSSNNPVQDNPNDALTLYKQAERLASDQNYTKALSVYDRAIGLDPDLIMAWFGRANTRFLLAELLNSERESRYSLSSSLNPHQGSLSQDTTLLNQSLKQVMQDYNKVISLDPGFSYAWFNRAYVKCLLGDYWGSVSDLSKAIKIDPKFSEAYYNKGLILIYQNLKAVGCDNLSQAGELGIQESYEVMKRYCYK